MRFTDALLRVGKAVPSVLETILGEFDHTSLEVVRHAACTGSADQLLAPPPVLVHESKMSATAILYGARKPSNVGEAAYKMVCPQEQLARVSNPSRMCLGACMMDVTATKARPAILFATKNQNQKLMSIEVEVWRAPVAAMEGELFSGMISGGFERRWLGFEQADTARSLRRDIGLYVRRGGYNTMPRGLHSAEFKVVRPGPLPLLRLRRPKNRAEVSDLYHYAASMCAPLGGCQPLASVLKGVEDWKIRVETTFFTSAETDQPTGFLGARGVSTAVEHPLMAPLALVVLKHLEDIDYLDMEEEDQVDGDDESEDGHGDYGEGEKLDVAMGELNGTEFAQVSQGEEDAPPASTTLYEDAFAAMLAPCGHTCSVKLMIRSTKASEVGGAVAKGVMQLEPDWSILQNRYATLSSSMDMLMVTGHMLSDRNGLLVVTKSQDGTIQDAKLTTHEGFWPITQERIGRYLMSPWATTILLDTDSAYEVQVNGLVREKLCLSERSRAEHSPKHVISATVPPSILDFIKESKMHLAKIPELLDRIDRLEKIPPPASILKEHAAQKPEQKCKPEQDEEGPCDVQLGFKRAADAIQAFNRAVFQKQERLAAARLAPR